MVEGNGLEARVSGIERRIVEDRNLNAAEHKEIKSSVAKVMWIGAGILITLLGALLEGALRH
jgi:hypothetical protein